MVGGKKDDFLELVLSEPRAPRAYSRAACRLACRPFLLSCSKKVALDSRGTRSVVRDSGVEYVGQARAVVCHTSPSAAAVAAVLKEAPCCALMSLLSTTNSGAASASGLDVMSVRGPQTADVIADVGSMDVSRRKGVVGDRVRLHRHQGRDLLRVDATVDATQADNAMMELWTGSQRAERASGRIAQGVKLRFSQMDCCPAAGGAAAGVDAAAGP